MSVSVTGKPFAEGDRVLYLCQCGRRSCDTGKRATVVSLETLEATIPDIRERVEEHEVCAQFDHEDRPSCAPGNMFIHLADLGVPEEHRGEAPVYLPEVRILVVDDATKDAVPTMTDMANIIVHAETSEIIKASPNEFSSVHVALPEQSLRMEEHNNTVKEAFLAIGFAIGHPNNN